MDNLDNNYLHNVAEEDPEAVEEPLKRTGGDGRGNALDRSSALRQSPCRYYVYCPKGVDHCVLQFLLLDDCHLHRHQYHDAAESLPSRATVTSTMETHLLVGPAVFSTDEQLIFLVSVHLLDCHCYCCCSYY